MNGKAMSEDNNPTARTLKLLNTKEFRVIQKTKVDGLYEETPKQFSDPTLTKKSPN